MTGERSSVSASPRASPCGNQIRSHDAISSPSISAPAWSAIEDVVLVRGRRRQDGLGFDADSGKQLWDAEHPISGYQSPQDLMVIDGLVWVAPLTSGKDSGEYTGRDPWTGEVKKRVRSRMSKPIGFIIAATSPKATDNFLDAVAHRD